MFKDFFAQYLPKRNQQVLFFLVLGLLLTYVALVPWLVGNTLFELFYEAGRRIVPNLLNGDFDYKHLRPDTQNYFKLSPFFALFPLHVLSHFPFKPTLVFWLLLNAGLYLWGSIYLLTTFKYKVQAGLWFAFLFAFVNLDLQINAAYGQVGGFLVGGSLLAIALFYRQKWVLAGIVLAFVTNMKLLPIIIFLLLATSLQSRFILSFLFALLFFYGAPALLFGWTANLGIHRGLLDVLAIDTQIRYADFEVHYHYGLRSFLQANWNWVPGVTYNLVPGIVGGLIGLGVFIKRKTILTLSNASLATFLCLAISYILLFNTRTEGPSTLFVDTIFGAMLARVFSTWGEPDKNLRTFLILVFVSLFLMLSISITDLGKLLQFHRFFWKHNGRTVAVMLLMLFSLVLLYNDSFRQKIWGKE